MDGEAERERECVCVCGGGGHWQLCAVPRSPQIVELGVEAGERGLDGAVSLGLGRGGGGGGGGNTIGDLLRQSDPGGSRDVRDDVPLHREGALLAAERGGDGLELLVHLEKAERLLTGAAEEGIVFGIDLDDEIISACPYPWFRGRHHRGHAVDAVLGAGQHGLGRDGIDAAVGFGQAVRKNSAGCMRQKMWATWPHEDKVQINVPRLLRAVRDLVLAMLLPS